MKFRTIEEIKQEGFCGFVPVSQLRENKHVMPAEMGLYMVLIPEGFKPRFLEEGTGGFFKGRNPNVSVSELSNRWVNGTCAVYIGKAGGPGLKATIRQRVGAYLDFGIGKAVGHSGGKAIWQLRDSDQLIVCWKPTPNDVPRDIETGLISDFVAQYGQFPFANQQL